jgi:hypothetical protein
MDVRETLTDKEGNFHFPTHVALSSPISTQDPTTFIIFKPGYASISNLNIGDIFTGGIIKENELSWLGNMKLKFRFAPGIVELPKVKSIEDRRIASEIGVIDIGSKKLPLLFKAINEEARYLSIPEREY